MEEENKKSPFFSSSIILERYFRKISLLFKLPSIDEMRRREEGIC
jgi:hypothetical protein